MIYTVHYTKKNSFMKEPRIRTKNIEGDVISDSKYVKPTVPKAMRNYVPHLHYKKNSFVVGLEQDELNKLVKEIGFYDDRGELIVAAPLKNPNAPFWKHSDLKLMLNASGTTLDDEVPIHMFWIKCFEADPRFRFSGDELPPTIAAKVNYTVTSVTDKHNEQTQSNDETFEAMKLLTTNEENHEKLTSVLKAMGVAVQDPNPKLVRDALLRKITEHKDIFVAGTGERNIEVFIRLMSSKAKTLEVKGIITTALSKGVIVKTANNIYKYGDIKLGSNQKKVEEFLNDKENSDVLLEIQEKIK